VGYVLVLALSDTSQTFKMKSPIPLRQAPSQPGRLASAAMPSLTSVFAGDNDLEALLEQFLVSIMVMAGAQAGAVRVLTDDGLQMRLLAHQGLPMEVVAQESLVNRNCGMCGIASCTDGLGWVDDLATCDHRGDAGYFGAECQHILAISLANGSDVLGIYNLFFSATPQISPQVESMLRLIGRMLGLALHNARQERERLRVTVMNERQELVNELHDAIAQTLAYAKMRMPLLNDAISLHDEDRALRVFADVKKAVSDAHDSLRQVMTCFKTRMDPLGLLHALDSIAIAYFDRTGIPLEVRKTSQPLNLSEAQEIQVFYIVQEALTNIAKHSRATNARLTIEKTPVEWLFQIDDNGQGMMQSEAIDGSSRHLGLGIMANRARRLGGELTFKPLDEGGTRVRLVVPISAVTPEVVQ
jgi:two-component system nitrate/nitrite sensor histidine kinase NarX